MRPKFIILAIFAGLIINMLLVVIPPSKQVAYYQGFREPRATEFTYGRQHICTGIGFTVDRSIHRTGYPLRSDAVMDFNECSGLDASPLTLFSKSALTLPFYINWLIWSVVCFGIVFIACRISYRKK